MKIKSISFIILLFILIANCSNKVTQEKKVDYFKVEKELLTNHLVYWQYIHLYSTSEGNSHMPPLGATEFNHLSFTIENKSNLILKQVYLNVEIYHNINKSVYLKKNFYVNSNILPFEVAKTEEIYLNDYFKFTNEEFKNIQFNVTILSGSGIKPE